MTIGIYSMADYKIGFDFMIGIKVMNIKGKERTVKFTNVQLICSWLLFIQYMSFAYVMQLNHYNYIFLYSIVAALKTVSKNWITD